MIVKHYSLRHADKVLAKLFEILGTPTSKYAQEVLRRNDVSVECWSNGREQGYKLHTIDKGVCFAQNRNSDDLVVVHGSNLSFDTPTNMPNSDVWQTRKLFGDDDDAVAYIIDKLGIIEGMITD